jgi:uncharacterized protein (DUF1810 family)
MSTSGDDLDRFVRAQARVYRQALRELEAGRKETHWMWFVLPQLRGLGQSHMAVEYGIADLGEAVAYAAHPVLGLRLRACVSAALAHRDAGAVAVFGAVDAMKFRSCLTLFAEAVPEESCFREALEAFYGAEPDGITLGLLSRA